jgi:DNA-binding SARP family transcriptional activator
VRAGTRAGSGSTLGAVATGVAAAVVVFGAVPTVLVVTVGIPLPRPWTEAGVVSLRGLYDLLALVAWVAWAACCWPLLRSVASRVRRRDAASGGGSFIGEWLATRIATAILAVVSVVAGAAGVGGVAGASGYRTPPAASAPAAPSVPSGVTWASGPSPSPVPSPATSPAPDQSTGALPDTHPPSTAEQVDMPAVSPTSTRYTVEAGDTLWSIADHLYDDGTDWPLLARANLGQLMAGGERFVDPSLILPGWVLTVPDDAANTVPNPGRPGTSTGPSIQATTATSERTATGDPPAAAGDVTASTAGSAGTTGGQPPAKTDLADIRPAGRRSTPPSRSPSPAPAPVPFPELAALGVGVVVASALARRARRSRALISAKRVEGEDPSAVSTGAADTAVLVAPFGGAPILDWIETGVRHLSGVLMRSGMQTAVPGIRALRAGCDGIVIHLDTEVDWAPSPWRLDQRPGRRWVLGSSADLAELHDESVGRDPWTPVLLPVGDGTDGSWFVPVGAGGCLPVLGAGADRLVAAMRQAVESWSWAEGLVVTDIPGVAVEAAASIDPGSRDGGPTSCVFFGDPDVLPEPARSRCAAVTVLPHPASGATVTVDQFGASLHPLGVTLRPHLLAECAERSLSELLDESGASAEPEPEPAPAPGPGPGPGPEQEQGPRPGPEPEPKPRPGSRDRRSTDRKTGNVVGLQHTVDRTTVRVWAPEVDAPDSTMAARVDAVAPGPVSVHLLTAVPRIDGLAQDPAPNRARRAVELVAYLALHHPDPVTSDRFRNRVLGSADADAATKTLFNAIGAARRALGNDAHGEPYIPLATKSGHYRISPAVSVDVLRVIRTVERADDVDDPIEAMALLRAALELVEGEPLCGVSAGYDWWSAEGHARRVAGSLVDGACRLARLAIPEGHVDLARWALDRARLADPYSEALSRSAMWVASAAGDIDGLRREWADCCRRVDELDPGSVPSSQTERLYTELRRRAPVADDATMPA